MFEASNFLFVFFEAPSAPPPDYPGSQLVKETSNTHHEVPRTVKSENRNESSDQASTSKGVSRSVPSKAKAPVISPSQAAEADGLSVSFLLKLSLWNCTFISCHNLINVSSR